MAWPVHVFTCTRARVCSNGAYNPGLVTRGRSTAASCLPPPRQPEPRSPLEGCSPPAQNWSTSHHTSWSSGLRHSWQTTSPAHSLQWEVVCWPAAAPVAPRVVWGGGVTTVTTCTGPKSLEVGSSVFTNWNDGGRKLFADFCCVCRVVFQVLKNNHSWDCRPSSWYAGSAVSRRGAARDRAGGPAVS